MAFRIWERKKEFCKIQPAVRIGKSLHLPDSVNSLLVTHSPELRVYSNETQAVQENNAYHCMVEPDKHHYHTTVPGVSYSCIKVSGHKVSI